MGGHSQLGKGGQLLEVAVVDASYFEYVVRAHDEAVSLRFASCVVDDRRPGARLCVAPFPGAFGVLSRPSFLRYVQLLRFG
jgi:hypothetical protein